MIDTHCHLTYKPLASRLDDVLALAAKNGVDRMISVGTRPDDAQAAAALAQEHGHIYSTVGLHPHYAGLHPDKAPVVETMRELLARPKVVAVGEMGLDRHYPDPPMDEQRRALDWQLETMAALARTLPGVIHNREATDETLAVLRASGIAPGRFVFHCFTGSDAELDAILAFGAMVSFTGIVTFKNATTLAASTARVPIDRVMVETDSPYLTPAPYRKVQVNEPGYVPYVARFLAAQRGMAEAEFVAAVDANAVRFFGLP